MPTKTYDLIASQTFSGASTTYSLTGIPSTYTDLVIIVTNFTSNGNGGGILWKFNNSTSDSYKGQIIYNAGSTTSSYDFTQTSGGFAYGGSLQANVPAVFKIDVARYADSNYQKTWFFSGGIYQTANFLETFFSGGVWGGTATISSFQLISNNANALLSANIYAYGIVNS